MQALDFPSVCLNNNETLDIEFHSMAQNLKFILKAKHTCLSGDFSFPNHRALRLLQRLGDFLGKTWRFWFYAQFFRWNNTTYQYNSKLEIKTISWFSSLSLKLTRHYQCSSVQTFPMIVQKGVIIFNFIKP